MLDTGRPSGPTTTKMPGSAFDCVSVNAAITITLQRDRTPRTIVQHVLSLCKELKVTGRHLEIGVSCCRDSALCLSWFAPCSPEAFSPNVQACR